MAAQLSSQRLPSRPGAIEDRPKVAGSVLLFEAQASVSGAPDILAELSTAEVQRVIEAGNRINFEAGDYLFQQGEAHRGIFVLRSGVVRSFYNAPNGREITLANWGAGNFVGGPDIFDDGPHVWSGIAARPGQAIQLSAPVVLHLMADIPSFSIGLVKGLAFKGKCYSSLLQMLATRSVVERLAHLLLNIAGLDGIACDGSLVIATSPSHEELATMVGATRQWISMTLERLRKRNLLETCDRRLVILKPAALRAVADGIESL